MPDTTEDLVADGAPDPINVAAEPAQPPDLVEYFSIGSHVGKTLFTDFTSALLRTVMGRDFDLSQVERHSRPASLSVGLRTQEASS